MFHTCMQLTPFQYCVCVLLCVKLTKRESVQSITRRLNDRNVKYYGRRKSDCERARHWERERERERALTRGERPNVCVDSSLVSCFPLSFRTHTTVHKIYALLLYYELRLRTERQPDTRRREKKGGKLCESIERERQRGTLKLKLSIQRVEKLL